MLFDKLFGRSKKNEPVSVDIDHAVEAPSDELSGVEALTSKGWVAIELLTPGDKLICALDGKTYSVQGSYS